MGGIKAYLGTSNCIEVEHMVEEGNKEAEKIYKAQAYQIAKGIGELSPTLKGNTDAIILTGGVAHSKMLTDWITEYVSFIAPVKVMAGENELESLSMGALRILKGEETAEDYRLR